MSNYFQGPVYKVMNVDITRTIHGLIERALFECAKNSNRIRLDKDTVSKFGHKNRLKLCIFLFFFFIF